MQSNIAESQLKSIISQEDLDKVVAKRLKEMQDIITANIEERIQDLLPLHEVALNKDMSNISITAKMLIQNAKSNDDYVLAASLIYSNIEEALIFKHELEHQNKKFIISYEEYIELANSIKIEDRYLLKKFDYETGNYEIISPRVVDFDLNGKPINVEMLPIVRFFKAGLSAYDAKQASDYWTVLNKIRHKSLDNEAYLNNHFEELKISKKEYLMQALSFFKRCGLYTKE